MPPYGQGQGEVSLLSPCAPAFRLGSLATFFLPRSPGPGARGGHAAEAPVAWPRARAAQEVAPGCGVRGSQVTLASEPFASAPHRDSCLTADGNKTATGSVTGSVSRAVRWQLRAHVGTSVPSDLFLWALSLGLVDGLLNGWILIFSSAESARAPQVFALRIISSSHPHKMGDLGNKVVKADWEPAGRSEGCRSPWVHGFCWTAP